MRLFVALPLEEAARQQLAQMSRQVALRSLRADIPPPENAHLTLAFIGESGHADAAAACVHALDTAPFPLVVTGIDRFRRAGVRPDAALLRLQAQLVAGLQTAGFAIEERPFRPHLTLARRVEFRRDEDFARLQAMFPPETPQCEMLSEWVCLMRSERIAGRQVYAEMSAKRL